MAGNGPCVGRCPDGGNMNRRSLFARAAALGLVLALDIEEAPAKFWQLDETMSRPTLHRDIPSAILHSVVETHGKARTAFIHTQYLELPPNVYISPGAHVHVSAMDGVSNPSVWRKAMYMQGNRLYLDRNVRTDSWRKTGHYEDFILTV